MAYVKINNAFFEDRDGRLAAVADGNIVNKLKSGQLSYTTRNATDNNNFGTDTTKTLPAMSETATTDLPQTESRASSFQNFSSALNRAVSLARQQRQSKDLDLVGKFVKPGSVSAGSFTSLLSDLNQASEDFSEPLVDNAMEAAKLEETNRSSIRDLALNLVEQGAKNEIVQGVLNAPDIDSAIAMAAGAMNATVKDAEIRSVGRQLVRINPQTGEAEVIFTAPPDSSGGGGSDAGTGFFKSGGLKIDNADIGQGSQRLAATRGEDGYVNTAEYASMYQHWVDNGGLPQDFFKNYDPDYYLNPNDTSIPTYIKSQMQSKKTTGSTLPAWMQ